MKTTLCNIFLLVILFLTACTADDLSSTKPAYQGNGDARELTGIRAVIESGKTTLLTRAGIVTPLLDYVGRNDFVGGDKIVFTEIRRTTTPLDAFTYPGKGYIKKVDGVDTRITYDGIEFIAGEEGGWARNESDNGPERVYWTDATNVHTFIAYSIPQNYGQYWKPYHFTTGTGDDAVRKTYYIGAIGNPTLTGAGNDTIDFTLTAEEQAANTATVNNVTTYGNPKLEQEDVVISYNTDMQAEPGGSVALVKFHHALSSIRIIANISGFSTGASAAADNATVVSNMRLLHQPTIYIWKQTDWQAQPMNATIQDGESLSDQEMINSAWAGADVIPAYNQRKALKLWIPQPAGSGSNQSKTFTFYGITTPQPSTYISTLDEDDKNRNAELIFDVTYPDPMKPSTTVTKTYKATVADCHFDSGYNTTINISLNHENEEMTVGVEYENWQFVATPDHSELKKNSTFMQDTERDSITIAADEAATADDATWLYWNGETLLDIYGHTGSEADAYQISTAYQLLSFAYEVKSGNDFAGKFIRLDADLTLQPTAKNTREETVKTSDDQSVSGIDLALSWIGIGDDSHAFNGTFLGGNRFIYRLKGSPFFVNVGSSGKIENLQVNSIVLGNSDYEYTVVEGRGLLADQNEGSIFGCKTVGNVQLSGDSDAPTSPSGALVGINSGKVFACYHIGDTYGTINAGGLIGSNSGTVASCYHAGKVTASGTTGGITSANTGTLDNNYYNSNLLTPSVALDGVIAKTSGEMTKSAFVDLINAGITTWFEEHTTGYDIYRYVYHPANYPTVEKE